MSDQETKKEDTATVEGGEPAGTTLPDPESPLKAKTSAGLSHHVVPTERCGAFNVYVQVSLKLVRWNCTDPSRKMTVFDAIL